MHGNRKKRDAGSLRDIFCVALAVDVRAEGSAGADCHMPLHHMAHEGLEAAGSQGENSCASHLKIHPMFNNVLLPHARHELSSRASAIINMLGNEAGSDRYQDFTLIQAGGMMPTSWGAAAQHQRAIKLCCFWVCPERLLSRAVWSHRQEDFDEAMIPCP